MRENECAKAADGPNFNGNLYTAVLLLHILSLLSLPYPSLLSSFNHFHFLFIVVHYIFAGHIFDFVALRSQFHKNQCNWLHISMQKKRIREIHNGKMIVLK